jgi:hypothetical protein
MEGAPEAGTLPASLFVTTNSQSNVFIRMVKLIPERLRRSNYTFATGL